MNFLVTLTIAIATTGLVSRLLFQVLCAWDGDLKPFAINVWSFILCGLLRLVVLGSGSPVELVLRSQGLPAAGSLAHL